MISPQWHRGDVCGPYYKDILSSRVPRGWWRSLVGSAARSTEVLYSSRRVGILDRLTTILSLGLVGKMARSL